LDKELHNLIKRAKTNGFTWTTPSETTRKIPKRTDLIVLSNRRLNKSAVIDPKKLMELLKTDVL